MRRRKAASDSKSERLKALPWAAVLQGVVLVGRRWRSLPAKDRDRLKRLVGDSHGRVENLSRKERAELRKLVGKLDLRGLTGELVALARGRGRGRRGRRGRA